VSAGHDGADANERGEDLMSYTIEDDSTDAMLERFRTIMEGQRALQPKIKDMSFAMLVCNASYLHIDLMEKCSDVEENLDEIREMDEEVANGMVEMVKVQRETWTMLAEELTMGHRDKECPHCNYPQYDTCCGTRTREVLEELKRGMETYEKLLKAREDKILGISFICLVAARAFKQRHVVKDWPALKNQVERLYEIGHELYDDKGDPLTDSPDFNGKGMHANPPRRRSSAPEGPSWKKKAPILIVDSEPVKVELWNSNTGAAIRVTHEMADGRLSRVYNLKDLLDVGR
jgi:hypothetical protein